MEASRIAQAIKDGLVDSLSKPGRSGGAIGAQLNKKAGAELVRQANKTTDKTLAAAMKSMGHQLQKRGKGGVAVNLITPAGRAALSAKR